MTSGSHDSSVRDDGENGLGQVVQLVSEDEDAHQTDTDGDGQRAQRSGRLRLNEQRLDPALDSTGAERHRDGSELARGRVLSGSLHRENRRCDGHAIGYEARGLLVAGLFGGDLEFLHEPASNPWQVNHRERSYNAADERITTTNVGALMCEDHRSLLRAERIEQAAREQHAWP